MPFVSGLTVVYSIHKIFPDAADHRADGVWQSRCEGRMPSLGRGGFFGETAEHAALLDVIEEVFASPQSSLAPAISGGKKNK